MHRMRLRYTEPMPGKVGRPVERSLRKRIRDLLESGESQIEIARKLDKAPSTIAHHVRATGARGKRRQAPVRPVRQAEVSWFFPECPECFVFDVRLRG